MEFIPHGILETRSANVSEVLMWIFIALLALLLVALVSRLFTNLKGTNQVFYSEKGAINLRVGKLPDIRIATKNCKEFMAVVEGNSMVISYANPFGGVKEFHCGLVGDPVKKPFKLDFTEADFKKLCHHLKPGNISVSKHKITLNYNLEVRTKLTYLKKEV